MTPTLDWKYEEKEDMLKSKFEHWIFQIMERKTKRSRFEVENPILLHVRSERYPQFEYCGFKVDKKSVEDAQNEALVFLTGKIND